jgi:hypothetical protein
MSLEIIIATWKDLNADNYLAWVAFIMIVLFLIILLFVVLHKTPQE